MGCGTSKPDRFGRDREIARPIYTPPQQVQSIDNWHSYPPSSTTQRVSVPSQTWSKSSPSPSPPGSYSQQLQPHYQPPFPAELPPSPNTQIPLTPPSSAWRHRSQSESPSPPPAFRHSSLSPDPAAAVATTAAPQCRKCGSPGWRSICQHPNANGNGGRPQYLCAQSDCNSFICFDDQRGVHLGNPECKCAGNLASRAMVTAKRQVIYRCARGQCEFWQRKYEANGGLAIVRSGPLTPQQAIELGF